MYGDDYVLDSLTGKLTEFINYIPLSRGVSINENIKYDAHGNVIFEKSKFLSVKANHDTIYPGQKISLSVKVLASCFPDTKDVAQKLVIGTLDDNFNLSNTDNLIIIPMIDGNGEYEVAFNDSGLHEIKGFVAEKAFLSDSSESMNLIYFSYPITVNSASKIAPLGLENYRLYDSLLGFERKIKNRSR